MFRRKRGPYEGRVAWVNDPFPHHVAMKKQKGELVPDYTRRLIWNEEKGCFEPYENGQPTHLMLYHGRHVELQVGGEE